MSTFVPASAMVGVSGKSGERVAPGTASRRTLSVLICGIAAPRSNVKSTWPPIRSTSTCCEPLYGTCTTCMGLARIIISAAMCCKVPMPAEP